MRHGMDCLAIAHSVRGSCDCGLDALKEKAENAQNIIFNSWFLETIEFLWKNRKNLPEDFDYPDYAGLPPKIANKLDGDFVDVIQYIWKDIPKFKNKNNLVNRILEQPTWYAIDSINPKYLKI